ncbi:nucleoside hydrolase [Oceanobacillus zhaokaii]|uniref:Nucleoside hydrolase n=1 Tax=Oceanobacillus zhaokaii TaxID=2052660 RepID=A0A345PF46_9BACI|nr:nucleoside hydrolase [Oceanobacillus zhaokaii]AXI08626.1 nucleoside hydrolase [Oceanobacillus zhaokaii]
MEKIILDVDTGIDDALAILLAVESGRFDILGITAVNGNVPLDYVIKNTKKVLKHTGKESINVYKGASRPILIEPFHEYSVHGNDGIGGALSSIEVDSDDVADMFAPDFIIEQAERHQGELTLIMVGPLTNLALALRKEPRLAKWIKQVVVMGGLVSEAGKGNTLPTSEFNMYADAEAAKMVFHSGIPLKLVSLDVTKKTFLTSEDIEKLKGTHYYDFVKECTAVYRKYSEENYGVNGCALHDPLTVGVVLDPTLVTTASYFVDIETKSELSYGQTICDFGNLWNKEPNVEICLDVDSERFISMFIDTLKNTIN